MMHVMNHFVFTWSILCTTFYSHAWSFYVPLCIRLIEFMYHFIFAWCSLVCIHMIHFMYHFCPHNQIHVLIYVRTLCITLCSHDSLYVQLGVRLISFICHFIFVWFTVWTISYSPDAFFIHLVFVGSTLCTRKEIIYRSPVDSPHNGSIDKYVENVSISWRHHELIGGKTLQWRHNEHDGVSNHQPIVNSWNRLFRRRSKKTSKPRVTGLCEGNSTVTCEFPAQRARTQKMFPFDDVIMND